MAVNVDDKFRKLSTAQRRKVEVRAAELIAEEMTLRELRKAQLQYYEATERGDFGMNYYLHRISHHAELAYPLLERGILSIGWSDFATREFVSSQQAKGWEDVPQTIDSEPGWEHMRSRFGLQRFLKMNVGDHVVVPSWGTFHVYEVVSDERLIADDLDLRDLKTWDGHGVRREEGQLFEDRDGQRQRHIDLGFFRRVRQVAKDIPRSGYADNALSSRLKVRQTNVEINDIRENLEQALAAWKIGRPIDLASEVMKKCADEVLNLIKEKLDQAKLEKLIKRYFERIGASSAVIPAKNERDKKGDADIVATFEPISTIIYVQAKHHVGTTDAWAVEQIDSYVKNKEELSGETGYTRIPWVISTALDFSTDCKDKAKRHQVRLVNGKDLATRMLEAGMAGLVL